MQQITINIIKIGRIYTFFKTKMSENSFFFIANTEDTLIHL